MSSEFSKPINRLVGAFRKLPGLGPRSALRMTWHIVEAPYEEVVEFARALVHVKKSIKQCSICCNYSDSDPCGICSDEKRDKTFICVVESPEDVSSLERAGSHPGVYHVLGGAIKPAVGTGPEDVRAAELVKRVQSGGVREVLLALNPSVEGEATALYLAHVLKPMGVRLTRPARGIPAGADLDYLDDDTLTGAFSLRQEVTAEEVESAVRKSENQDVRKKSRKRNTSGG